MQKILGVLIVIISICSSCGLNKSEEIDKQIVTIATLKGPSAMSMVWMMDSLNLVQDKIQYEFIVKDEPLQIRKMMLEGTADFTVLPTTMASILYNKGINYQLAAIPCWGTLYLFGSDTTIHSWNDLVGKRINLMARGMTPDVMFRYLLEKNNISIDNDVMIDYSFPTHIDLANAVAANRAELGVISEPLVSLVMQKNPNIHPIFSLNDEWNKVHQDTLPVAMTALMVNQKFTTQKNLVKEFLVAYNKSINWINENQSKGAELIVKYNILPNTKVAESSIPRSNLEFKKAYDIRKKIDAYLEIFYTLDPKIVGGKIPDEGFYFDN